MKTVKNEIRVRLLELTKNIQSEEELSDLVEHVILRTLYAEFPKVGVCLIAREWDMLKAAIRKRAWRKK